MAKHRFVIEGRDFEVEVHARRGNRADVTVNGKRLRVELGAEPPPQRRATAVPPSPRAASKPTVHAPDELRAPMAGLVLQTPSVGQSVKAGETLLVLDAMKMENSLAAPRDGVVKDVAVSRGDSVLRGALLVRLG